MKKIAQVLYTIWVGFWFIFWMIALSPFIGIPLFWKNGFKKSYPFIRLWVKILSLLTGIRFRIFGRENLAGGKPCIYVINHTSYLDAPAIPAIIPDPVKAIGKKELSKVPLFGQLTSGFAVWVDRKDAASRKASLAATRQVLESGTAIVIAAEGRRSWPEEGLLPFKDGAFRLAIETQTEIRPIIIKDAAKLMPRGTFLVWPGIIEGHILPPVPLGAEDSIEGYKAKVRGIMVGAMLDCLYPK
jgi:1-acyl-sn-glycerol-3-phosphate acyltransferase